MSDCTTSPAVEEDRAPRKRASTRSTITVADLERVQHALDAILQQPLPPDLAERAQRKAERERLKAERDAARSARREASAAKEAAKREATVRRLEKALLKTQMRLNRIEWKKRKAQAARAQVPQVENVREAAERSASASPAMHIDGFTPITDVTTLSPALEALNAGHLQGILQNVAAAFGVSKHEVLLIEQSIRTRKGSKTAVIRFRYAFNPVFNDVLRDAAPGAAFFDAATKGWTVPAAADGPLHAIAREVPRHFSVVIDLTSLAVQCTTRRPDRARQTTCAFLPMPFHVEVALSSVLSAVEAVRPGDFIRDETLHIHDGSAFVALPKTAHVFWTRMPFLLYRYSVHTGRPRYVSYSTLAKAVEGVAFDGDKAATIAIARYMDACAVSGLPPYEQRQSAPALPAQSAIAAYRGGFDRFSAALHHLESAIPGLRFSPLCSDYTTLLLRNYGADTERANIEAYAPTGARLDGYMRLLARSFGDPDPVRPIVFTRSVLDAFASSSEREAQFTDLVTHELAHWLAKESGCSDVDSHGHVFAVCKDTLDLVVFGRQRRTVFRDYHPEFPALAEHIEHAVMSAHQDGRLCAAPMGLATVKAAINQLLHELATVFTPPKASPNTPG